MANLVQGLVAYLLTQSAITAIIAGGDSIQPIPAPVDADLYPCIAYQVVSDVPGYTLSDQDGVTHARILFSCLASYGSGSYTLAHGLALAVKAALSGYSGTLPDGTVVSFIKVANLTDMYQSDALLSATNISVLVAYQD